jgi:hypothetical protein
MTKDEFRSDMPFETQNDFKWKLAVATCFTTMLIYVVLYEKLTWGDFLIFIPLVIFCIIKAIISYIEISYFDKISWADFLSFIPLVIFSIIMAIISTYAHYKIFGY